MDLQQELRRSPYVVTPWTETGRTDDVPTLVSAATATTEPGRPVAGPGDPTTSHLVAVRLSAPSSTKPIDRVLRPLDFLGAIAGLVIMAPVLVMAALAIRLSSRGPVIYSQTRVGRDGRPFRCHKLRTMANDADRQLQHLLDQDAYVDQWRRACKLDDDPRVTRVGRLLRATDLDELPQLWNVLRGDMSLVGPRPVPDDEAERYGADLATVLSVRPGMTGMWQVGGRHQVSYDERIALDVRYVESRNVRTNIRLLVRTVVLIATRRNGAS